MLGIEFDEAALAVTLSTILFMISLALRMWHGCTAHLDGARRIGLVLSIHLDAGAAEYERARQNKGLVSVA